MVWTFDRLSIVMINSNYNDSLVCTIQRHTQQKNQNRTKKWRLQMKNGIFGSWHSHFYFVQTFVQNITNANTNFISFGWWKYGALIAADSRQQTAAPIIMTTDHDRTLNEWSESLVVQFIEMDTRNESFLCTFAHTHTQIMCIMYLRVGVQLFMDFRVHKWIVTE